MTTTNKKTTHREGTRWVESKPLEGALAMTTVPNTNDDGNALAEARTHLDLCKRKMEALDKALAAYTDPEALEIVRKIDAEGYKAGYGIDASVNYAVARWALFSLRHPKLARLVERIGGAE